MKLLFTLFASSSRGLSLPNCRSREGTIGLFAHGDDSCSESDRPLLKEFGKLLQRRIRRTEDGENRAGQEGAYSSHETIPCLEMMSDQACQAHRPHGISSKSNIQKAFTACDRGDQGNVHGRSSGSGSAIIRLRGADAASIKGLLRFSKRFFDKVDEEAGSVVKDVGVMRLADHVYAGFDQNVNDEGKMQFLDTRILPGTKDGSESVLLPLEVGELVGSHSLNDAHQGMDTLFNIGLQITSAVLDTDAHFTKKIIDSGKHQSSAAGWDAVSNSYHRLIRYMKPADTFDAAFSAHVDSSFLTLIPLPERPGLEVWCPEKTKQREGVNDTIGGEWVSPAVPLSSEMVDDEDCVYVIVLAGEFLELLSDGEVPVCIHRVIAPSPVAAEKYRPRISAPLFLRPLRCEDALINVRQDLKSGSKQLPMNLDGTDTNHRGEKNSPVRGLYHQNGLVNECDGMHLWSVRHLL